ncbi:hypothetical protein [Pseudomonas sp. HLMP]|uniref:hypothetical protein n=1 Tax=Pseudomonas sp. HLMP TaxID=3153767 RepID=UPI003966ED5F
MPTEKNSVEALMKACQRGVTGKGPAIEVANNLLAECYGALGKLVAEKESLRKDAERYRFVSKLAWYVDAAAHVYNVCNVNAQWSDQRGHPDTDDIECAIDATMEVKP